MSPSSPLKLVPEIIVAQPMELLLKGAKKEQYECNYERYVPRIDEMFDYGSVFFFYLQRMKCGTSEFGFHTRNLLARNERVSVS